jgi:hypothetical protein
MADEVTILAPSPYKPPTVNLRVRTEHSRTIEVVWVWGHTQHTDHFRVLCDCRDAYGTVIANLETVVDPTSREASFDTPVTTKSATVGVIPVSMQYPEDHYVYDSTGNVMGYHPEGSNYFTPPLGQNIYTFPDEETTVVEAVQPVSNVPDWTKSMKRTYEYYKVDPMTWLNTERVENVISSSITRDSGDDTLGSATFDISADMGECYIRTYMVMEQDNRTYKVCLGTHLCQTRGVSFDGKRTDASIDGYTALIELKEQMPPIGYAVHADRNILEVVSNIVRETIRPPITRGVGEETVSMAFVADVDETWFSFLSDLLAMGRYEFGLDETGAIILPPKQDFNSLQPVWTYNDDNSSILQPDITVDRDLYGIPNVMEVVYSSDSEAPIYSRIVNDDPNSPVSTVARGREIVQRETNPELYGVPDQVQLDSYARQKLRDLSALEYTITYKHAYCPVRLNDCVMLNYRRAGLQNVKAKVIRQSITCDSGGQVEETAIYTTNLWG